MAKAWADMGEPNPKVEAARGLLALQNKLNSEENGFTVPININGRIAGLSMYVVNERAMYEDGARILISLDAGALGDVQGYLTLNDGAAEIAFTAETEAAADALRSGEALLTALLAEAGIGIRTINFSVISTVSVDSADADPTPAIPATDSAHEYRV
jgi:flagellar hook-length control protein FliK